MHRFHNDGPLLVETNYWSSPHALIGYYFFSFNAGALRVLLPKARLNELEDMRTAKTVILSRAGDIESGRDAYELLFDDDSDSPYRISIGMNQADRLLPVTDHGKTLRVLVYTSDGLAGEWPCRFRSVKRIPCLEPWSS